MNLIRTRKRERAQSRFISSNRNRLELLTDRLEAVDTAIRNGELDTSSKNVGGESREVNSNSTNRES